MYVKYLSRFCWLFVGIIFIISGLIKLNDPVGTAIKLEEYFEVFAIDFAKFFLVFKGYTRTMSIVFSTSEVVLGVALLLRWQLKYVLRALLGLIIFFSFLTFYSAFFNKVTDCGCFGDAIKLKPWTSFTKDIVLLVMIIVLLRTHERWLRPWSRRPLIGTLLVTTAAGIAVGIGMYALGHLPIFDPLPYRKGAHIPTLRKPAEAPRYAYTFTDASGKEVESEKWLNDPPYKYKDMKVLNPEASTPKITDFRVWNDRGDYTDSLLVGTKLVLVIQGMEHLDRDRMPQIAQLLQQAAASPRRIQPIILTAASPQEFEVFRTEKKLAAPYYFADATVLKMMIRSNPGMLLLRDGTVLDKWHYHDLPSLRGIEKELER